MPTIPHERLRNYSFLGSEVVMTAVIYVLSWNIPWPLDAICYNYCCKAFGALRWDFTLKHSCKLLTLFEVFQSFSFLFFSFFKHGNSHTKMIICRWSAHIGWETTVSWTSSENKTFNCRSHTFKKNQISACLCKKMNKIWMQQTVLKRASLEITAT